PGVLGRGSTRLRAHGRPRRASVGERVGQVRAGGDPGGPPPRPATPVVSGGGGGAPPRPPRPLPQTGFDRGRTDARCRQRSRGGGGPSRLSAWFTGLRSEARCTIGSMKTLALFPAAVLL